VELVTLRITALIDLAPRDSMPRRLTSWQVADGFLSHVGKGMHRDRPRL